MNPQRFLILLIICGVVLAAGVFSAGLVAILVAIGEVQTVVGALQ